MKPYFTKLASMAALVLAVAATSCGGGSGGAGAPVGGITPPPPTETRKTVSVGEPGGLELTIRDEVMFADAEVLVEVVRTGEIVVPPGFTAAGGAVTTSPPGTSFEFPAQLGIPVDPSLVPAGLTLNDLVIFQRNVNDNSIRLLPVIDVDEAGSRVFASVTSLSTFQVAAPYSTFRITPRESLLEQLGMSFGIDLGYSGAHGAVTYQLAAVEQVGGAGAGGTAGTGDVEPNEDGNFVIAPGVILTPQGRIQGTPQEAGTWTFTVAASDSATGMPNVAALSLSLSVMSKSQLGVPGFPINESTFAYASNGDAIAVTNSGGVMTVHRIPADGSQTISSAPLSIGGINPAVAVHPAGGAIVVAFERVVSMTLDFGVSQLVQVLRADATGAVNGVSFDLNGDGAANVVVDFEAATSGFTGTEAELNSLADALNVALSAAAIPVDAVANVGINGIRFVDQGTGYFVGGAIGQVQTPRLMAGGASLGAVVGGLNTTPNGSFRRIYAVEIGSDLTVTQGPFRVDTDPIYDPEEPDTSATSFSRQALRPGVAFAVSPTATTVAANAPYVVAYEVIRNLTIGGGLRADVYGAWRSFGAGARTLPTRLDATNSHGDSSGNRVVVAGTESGASVLWIERGGEPETSPEDVNESATPGDLAAVELPVPGFPTAILAVQSGVPEPAFVNESDTTSAQHPAVTVSRSGEVWVVWSERDDTPNSTPGDTEGGVAAATSGRGYQSSAILVRRNLSLRAGRLSGGTVADPFQVDVVNNQSSAYSTAITVSSEDEIAVSWVEAPFNGPQKGYLRRFFAPGVPLELPLFVSFPIETIIHYDAEDRLGLLSRAGGNIHVFDFAPEPLAED